MMARAALVRSSAGVWRAVKRTLLVCACVALAYLLVRAALSADHLMRAVSAQAPLALAGAALIYLAGHGVRILRLALLIGGWRVGFRDIASFHLMTAAVSLAAPLKLGEVYRVIELSNIAGSFLRAVMIAWCERAFDTALILAMLVLAMAATSSVNVAGIALFAALFIALTAIVFFLAPDNLRRLSILIIRRYNDPRSVPVLRALDMTRRAILAAPALVRGKLASLSAMTMLIWLCEIAAFALIMPALGASPRAALDGLLSFLSAITAGHTLIDAFGADALAPSLTYLAATQVPLVALGVFAALYYAPRRFSA